MLDYLLNHCCYGASLSFLSPHQFFDTEAFKFIPKMNILSFHDFFWLKNAKDCLCTYIWVYISIYVCMHVWNMCLLNTCIFFAISIFMCHSPFKIIPFKSYNKKAQTSLPTPSNNRLFVNQAYSSSLLIRVISFERCLSSCSHSLED